MLIVLQGSGKTLAYGLPILSKLLEEIQTKPLRKKRHVSALVITPTRELALQISSHLNACLASPSSLDTETEPHGKSSEGSKEKVAKVAASKAPPLVSVAAIVGGMSAQKQRRILNRGADVLVATPGRLWDLLQEVRGSYSPFVPRPYVKTERCAGATNQELEVSCPRRSGPDD